MATRSAKDAPKFAVHVAKTDDDRRRVYAFRYRTLVKEMDGDSVFADHDAEIVTDEHDNGALHLFITEESEVVAAVRINPAGQEIPKALAANLKTDAFKEFSPTALSVTTSMMVAERRRESNVAQVLLGAAYKIARKSGSRFDFCICPPALVRLYERLGYRRYADNFVDEDDGYCVPLVLLTEDLDRLKAMRSPFAKFADEFSNSAETSRWFDNAFADYATPASELNMDEEEFWEFLTKRMHQTPLVGIPILKDIHFGDAKKLVKAGTILRCKAGDQIVRAGDIGREMFVVLAGSVDVKGAADETMTTLGTGAVFGEIALFSSSPRTANVVAAEDVEVLIITQEYLRSVMRVMPEVAVILLFNLSHLLSERLGASTKHWIDATDDEAAHEPEPEPVAEPVEQPSPAVPDDLDAMPEEMIDSDHP